MTSISDTPDPLDLDFLDSLVLDDQVTQLRAWRLLVRPLGFDSPGLWLMLIDEHDHPLPGIVEVTDCGDLPTPEELDGMAAMLRGLLDDLAPAGRVAMLRSRPGDTPPDETDRTWAAALVAACRRGGVPTDLVHLATDRRLVPLPFDDLPTLPATA